jgi:hypothetical protein
MTWPHVDEFDWTRRKPLKYRDGSEKMETLLLFSSAVTVDADGRRLISAGTILCEITSGNGDGKYGPYDKTATDGRQTIGASVQTYVALAGHDVTLGDKAVEGLWMGCVFNKSELYDVNGISDNDTELAKLKTAFPLAGFA